MPLLVTAGAAKEIFPEKAWLRFAPSFWPNVSSVTVHSPGAGEPSCGE
jgi:hypothetical protein